MYNKYESPFSTRYASAEMQTLFSQQCRVQTWRELWVALSKAQQAEGLDISNEQIAELAANVSNINFDVAATREVEVRHDVMAHIYAYGQQCPKAAPIIHLGATSCYVTDNGDIIIMRKALEVVAKRLAVAINNLLVFIEKYKETPTLGYTHLQPAQLTTVGKRASLWAYDLLLDLQRVEAEIASLVLLGSKGATGTQNSFLELFDGDMAKVDACERRICEQFSFSGTVPVSGQTYTRKFDSFILNTLSGIAQSAAKFAGDMRLLQGFKELEEPFEKEQVGSSAMPYKRNPMRCERITSLARYAINNAQNAAHTAAAQWLERTLDDSANRRIAVAEQFLAADAILRLVIDVTSGIVVNEQVIASRIDAELPFMATENILMLAVKKGGNRQTLHKSLRALSLEAAANIKMHGKANNLMELIENSGDFTFDKQELSALLDAKKFTGAAALQAQRFADEAAKHIAKYSAHFSYKADIEL